MNANITAQLHELENNLADMYIMHDADRQIRGENYQDYNCHSYTNINVKLANDANGKELYYSMNNAATGYHSVHSFIHDGPERCERVCW